MTRTITRKQALLLMRNRLWERTNYIPHAKQREVHDALERGSRFIVTNWGRRTGKTICYAERGLWHMGQEPPANLPKRLIWCVGPTYDITEPIFEYLWKWICDDKVLNGYSPTSSSVHYKYIEMPWKARIACKTTERPRGLRGKGVVCAIVDEDADCDPETIDKYLIHTLSDVGGELLVSSTPQGRLNHFYDLWEDYIAAMLDDPAYFALHATSYDNPHIDHGAIEKIREKCERKGIMHLYRQEVLAEFTAVSGAIYPNFMPEKNGIPWHVQDFEHFGFPFHVGADSNFEKPFAALFGQQGEDSQLYIVDEIYEPGLTDPRKAQATLDKADSYDRFIELSYCDPSAASMKQTFRDYGISVWEPHKTDVIKINDVANGIDLLLEKFGREDKPGIIIHSRCVNLIAELQGYHYKKGKPVKDKDHACDALRYLNTALYGASSVVPAMFTF